MPPTPPLPTLYKARGLSTKQPVCAICVERTRGRTEQVRLGYGVGVDSTWQPTVAGLQPVAAEMLAAADEIASAGTEPFRR